MFCPTRLPIHGLLLGLSLTLAPGCFFDTGDNNDDNANANAVSMGGPLDCDYFDENDSLPNINDGVDYQVESGCILGIGSEVSIEPGVVLTFGSDAGVRITGNGALSAVGTEAAPIVFRGATETKGAWRGIFVDSNNVNNRLEFVEIAHAGSNSFNSNDDRGSIVFYGGALTLKNSTLRDGLEYGLNVPWPGRLTFERNTITGHDKEPVVLKGPNTGALDVDSDLSGNAEDRVRVITENIGEDMTWGNLSVPWFIGPGGGVLSVNNDATLTIEEGATLIFGANAGLRVNSGGAIVAEGSEGNRITFTGSTEAPGAWRGLFFDTANVATSLDYVEIAYAGSDSFNSNGDKGAIIVWADAYFSLTNSIVRDIEADCGINAPYDDETLVEMNNDFSNVSTPVCME